MSNPFALAAVTTTFSQFLQRVIEAPTLTGASVSVGPPDAARAAGGTGRQLNLFLYRLTANPGWQNADLPVRNSAGELVSQPVLALDLHYLLTAYGDHDSDLDAEHLLAHAMSLVHDQGIFTRDQIRASITAAPSVAGSDLADQIETVKVSPEPMTLEELSKLWSMFQTTNYRLSVGYQASVTLISRPHAARSSLPVRAANVYALPVGQPVIERMSPAALQAGAVLTISGRNLQADLVRARFGSLTVPPDSVSDRQIEVTLPTTLSAGVNAVRVVHELQLGSPPTPHRGAESNLGAFVLVPVISSPAPLTAARGSALSLTFTPLVSRSQHVSILVGDTEITVAARAPGSAPVSQLDFPIPAGLAPGTYLLRLRVDGAESGLMIETDPMKPTFNQYVAPAVTVT